MSEVAFASMTMWEYRDTSPPVPRPVAKEATSLAPAPLPGLTEEQVSARVRLAVAEAEQRWAAEVEARDTQRAAQLKRNLEAFARERARYFRDAEREVVLLALAIARKVLQREAALDPDLLAALVRIALERMAAGTAARLRVPPAELARWQRQDQHGTQDCPWEIVPDASMPAGECLVETDLGSATFGFEVQLKEIEQGMLDLLERRPLLPAVELPAPLQTAESQ